MIENSEELIKDFVKAAWQAGYDLNVESIMHEPQPAPHRPHSLPSGKCAVYVFSLKSTQGCSCPAGANRVLKVGRVGPNSNACFQSQHYNPKSAKSNLSATLIKSRIFWHYLGIESIDETSAGIWIKDNLDRDNFYMDATKEKLLGELEKYLRGRLGPVFEGG
jgi:hypothetical protein